MKLSRLIGILLIIESKQLISAKELAELFEVSVRTIYRDVDLLAEAGIPIAATSGPSGGFSFMEGYRLNSKSLDTKEMEKLIFSVYSQTIKEKDQAERDTLLLKFKKIIPQSEQKNFERLLDKTKVDSKSWWGGERVAPLSETNLEIIQRSIYKLKKIVFDYESNTSFTAHRILRPYGIVHKGEAWYAVGYAEERGELRTFHCDRMRNIQVIEETYSIPEEFDLNLYWERSTRAFIRSTTATAEKESKSTIKYPVHLGSKRNLEDLLGSFTIIKKETSNSGYSYQVDLISERTALNLLLPHLGEVKILEPQDFRKKIIQLANNICHMQND